jgi:hypothetical protein
MVTAFPPLAWLRVPPRIWCLVIVALIVLAGYGLQALSSVRLRLKPDQRPVFVTIVGVLIVAELLWTDVDYIVGKPQSQWLDLYQQIAQTLLDDGVTRFYSPTYSFPQQAASYWRIPDFGGVDPLQLRSYVVEFEQATGTLVNSYTVTLPPLASDDLRTANRDAVIDAQKLGEWGVSHVVSAYPLTTVGLEPLTQIDGVYIYRNTLITADLPASSANPNCQQPPSVFPYLPGWYGRSLSVDASNDQFGEMLPCYTPTTLVPSLAVSGIGLLICLGLFIIGGRRA